ncbi:unnamed protein product [Plutella xylostella]|uniref:(diamondback moth) hypothetical protein n=1 Tax=Plutella xylostella TaxID=51655 RepID=A0A8S4GCC0_PLUXY|nr:unnamed protein product [Plutella xylostella]
MAQCFMADRSPLPSVAAISGACASACINCTDIFLMHVATPAHVALVTSALICQLFADRRGGRTSRPLRSLARTLLRHLSIKCSICSVVVSSTPCLFSSAGTSFTRRPPPRHHAPRARPPRAASANHNLPQHIGLPQTTAGLVI